ncbi:GNAT family N-acetyltransferase, cg3035/Rv0428c family [Mycobacterium asiaticum]|uniref:GCN5 family acetyltransferase n=1 Tax=Mycobacterium asiaticum TaxID=1790 RepID=A0A1A3N3V2_MYCAS|nr:GCN5 family acetyltransferase [Mycobacterium asiaticum]OBK15052.1 GCN5 family acetyltransferase [Mycobacterium asiaticum]
MISWPAFGTRVTLRYRRPPGSVPPLTDALGHLLAVDPAVRVRTKSGVIVEVAPADVVALRILTDAPVRTADIRALEHAAAAAWPGTEHAWLEGWLLRAHGTTLAANSAMPLDISASVRAVPAIIRWYLDRGMTPRLAVPDRLLPTPPESSRESVEQVLVRDIGPREFDPSIGPNEGEQVAVTDAPDGTRWVALSAMLACDAERCAAALAWGASRGATRAHLAVPDGDSPTPAQSLGFRLHHRRRYVLPSVS